MYVNILHEFPAIVSCLEEQITNGVIPMSDARSREKAVKARELKGKILNAHFLLVFRFSRYLFPVWSCGQHIAVGALTAS